MLTNLDWIKEGSPFPPKAEHARLRTYADNEKLFNGDHADVFRSDFTSIEDRLKKHQHIDPISAFNYPRLLSTKTADFVCGEAVIVEAGNDTDGLNKVLSNAGFDQLLYEAMMDVSRFGNAPIKIMNNRVSLVSPDCWFPIVDATDLKHITQHVIAFPTKPDEEGVFHEIRVEIHSPGSVEVRQYNLESGSSRDVKFGGLISAESTGNTGVDDFAVIVLSNLSHSKSVFGLDDYGAIAPIVKNLMWRVHCINKVLDKHSEPSLSGPESAMRYDEATGMRYLDLHNYFMRNSKDEPGVEYLTWDGSLESSFREIEMLLDQLYILSEMGASFMDAEKTGQVQSGTALKLRMTSPRIKAQRIANINAQAVKQVISAIAAINNIHVDAAEIALSWNDGLPNDPKEDIEILLAANGGLPVESQQSGIKQWNGVDDNEAAKIQRLILADQAMSNPYMTGGGINDTERKVREEVPTAD